MVLASACALASDAPGLSRRDVLVKGSDYAPGDVVGGAEAAQWGGRVAIVELLEGRSTTGLLTGTQQR